jgi:hypothetical protein
MHFNGDALAHRKLHLFPSSFTVVPVLHYLDSFITSLSDINLPI